MSCQRTKVESIIKDELSNAGIDMPWDMREIHVLPHSQCVVEHTSSEGTLSEVILNHHFPRIKDEIEVAHFTSIDVLQSIAKLNEFRLYSLSKRLNQQEFEPFCQTHGLTSYLDDSEGEPYYKTLVNSLHYSSFTQVTNSDEEYMWDVFAKSGTGVKLIIKLKPIQKKSELRPVLYHSKKKDPSTLLQTIHKRILEECGRYFIIRGISRIGAFYLPFGFQLEKEEEVRLVVKNWGSGPAFEHVREDSKLEFDYIPLGLGEKGNQFCNISVERIICGPKAKREEVFRSISDTPLSSTPIDIQ